MRFTVHLPPLVNYTPTTRQQEIKNSMFRTPVDGFIPDFLRAQNIVRVIDGTGETKIGSSQREFELSRVGVTEGKITRNV